MPTVASAFDGERNNFNLIRMLAALSVLFSHCWPLTGQAFQPHIDGYETIGGLGVAAFFVISGFLVTRSLLRRDVDDYLLSRALRILPGLAVVVLLSALVIGPIFTTVDLSVYFSSAATWSYLSNAAIFYYKASLPGVFDGRAVNGSLWTLPLECGFYLILPLLQFGGALTKKGATIFWIAFAVAFFWLADRYALSVENQGGHLWASAPLFSTMRYFLFFFAGALFWIHRDRIPCSPAIALIMVSLLFVCAKHKFGDIVLYVALPYLVIYFALTKSSLLGGYRLLGDYSYGTYILAFPVQQAIVALCGSSGIGPWWLFLLAAPMTLCLAIVSWTFIEHPALRLRNRFYDRPARTQMAGHESAAAAE